MPRTKAAFDLTYYDDPDVLALSPDAERLYMRLVISPTLSQAGTGPWQPNQLLRQLPDLDHDTLVQAAHELEEARFAFIDFHTEEVFVRALMRRDGIAKQPNVLNSACGDAMFVRSPKLRPEVGTELERIRVTMYPDPDTPGLNGPRKSVARKLREVIPVLLPEGIGNPNPTPAGNPSDATLKQGTGNPSDVTLKPKPHGEGEGVGVGEIITTEGGTGGEVARAHEPAPTATDTAATTPPPGNLDPDNPRCDHHAHIPADDRGPNCLACRRVRQWCEQAPDRAHAERARIAANARTRIAECSRCDDAGWLLDHDGTPVEPAVRCAHIQPQEAQRA